MITLHRILRPSLIVFDLDNTLYDYDKSNNFATNMVVEGIASHINIDSIEVKQKFDIARMNVKSRLGYTASSHSRILYISEIYRLFGLKPDTELFLNLEELFWASFLGKLELFPGAMEFLDLIRESDITLALVTDLTSSIQYRKISKLGLNSYFDFILTSEEVGGDKSTGLPFEFLRRIYRTIPSGSWFIGDSKFDNPQGGDDQVVFFKKVAGKTGWSQENQFDFQRFDEIKLFLM